MKRYEKYIAIPSTVSPEMPEAWTAKKLKFVLSYSKGKQPSQLTEEPIGDPYATMDYLRGRNCILQYPVSTDGLVHIDSDSLLVLWDGANAGEFLRGKDGYLGSTMAVIEAGDNMDKSYLFYLLKGSEALSKMIAGGTTIPHFSPTFFDEVFAIPSLDEQHKIAAFLDYKTGKIDRLTEKLNARIDDLKKYRQSVIIEAVTHGLDLTVPLKSSGVEWIGSIPENWTPLRCGLLFRMGSGTTPKSGNDSYYCEDGKYWLQTGDLTDGLVYKTSKHLSDKAFEDYSLSIYPKGSVVIAMYGATIGKLGILDIDAATNQACCVFTVSERMINRFAYYCLMASRESLKSLANGGGQPNISQAQLKDWKLPVPPIEEQKSIVEYLDRKTKQIDDTIAATEQQIKDFQEYRISLISEAVTGQIDVRDWTAPVE